MQRGNSTEKVSNVEVTHVHVVKNGLRSIEESLVRQVGKEWHLHSKCTRLFAQGNAMLCDARSSQTLNANVMQTTSSLKMQH
jgi:hypothetical protein